MSIYFPDKIKKLLLKDKTDKEEIKSMKEIIEDLRKKKRKPMWNFDKVKSWEIK